MSASRFDVGGSAVRIVALAAVAGSAFAEVRADAWDRAVDRAKALCAKMTLEEKAGEMTVYDYRCFGADPWGVYTNAVNRNGIGALMRVKSADLALRLQKYKMAHSRLGIPMVIHEDVVHGFVTALPVPIGIACSWDDEAVERAEAVAAREAAAAGIQMTYSPQADVSDDPRWGRALGTPGEDPYLASRIVAARVRGDQGRTLEELTDGRHVIACVKHYVGYSSLQAGKDYRHRDFSRRELFETHLLPFKAAIDAGALAVMNAYTAFEGVPVNFSRYLMTDLLRGELGFRGQLVTDWTTFAFSVDEGAAKDLEDAAVRGLAAGIDMDMISDAYLLVPRLVREGKVSVRDVDAAVIRSLAVKYLMGLFDDPYRFGDGKSEAAAQYTPENRRDVLALARESIVLLKNNGGILPLDPSADVALTGRWADDVTAHRGGTMDLAYDLPGDEYATTRERKGVTTLKSAMSRRWKEHLVGFELNTRRIARGEARLPETDVVVLALGEPPGFTGERINRATLRIPDAELETLRYLRRSGKKVVSVVYAGRPVLMNEIVDLSDAVLLAWYPGSMGGEALGEILSGETNPSGKLCTAIPLDAAQIPCSYREKRTFIPTAYTDIPATPLFPFGYGLGYSAFAYSKPVLSKPSFVRGEKVGVSVKVRNTGARRGREIVELYVRDENASVLPRERELREFTSVTLDPGEEREVSFTLDDGAFALYDKDLKRVVEPGNFTIFVGPDSTTRNAVTCRITE